MFSKKFFFVLIFVISISPLVYAGLDLALAAGANTTADSLTGGPWFNLVFPNSFVGVSGGLLVEQYGVQLPLSIDLWPTSWTGLGAGLYGALPGDYGVVFNGQIKVPVGVVWFVMLNALDEIDLNSAAKSNTLLLLAGTGLAF